MAPYRSAALNAEDRLAGLSNAGLILALPDDALRGLLAEYQTRLPANLQDQISRRCRE